MDRTNLSIKGDLTYIRTVFELLALKARLGFDDEGRGAMIIDLSHGPEPNGGYLSLSRLLVELGNLPDEQWETTLQGYDPDTEFVAIVRRPDLSLHGYILSYSERITDNQF